MNTSKLAVLAAAIFIAGCDSPQKQATKTSETDTVVNRPATPNVMTLPALDALFYEPDFAAALKSKLGFTAA